MKKPLATAAFSFVWYRLISMMQEISFAVSPGASLKVQSVGRTQTPVIVIDDFGQDLQPLIANACESSEYTPDPTSKYPGLRAKLPISYTREVMRQVYRLLFSVYAIPENLGMKAVNAAYSLITIPEHELRPNQCVPHFDSSRPHYLAILHYLNDGDYCDTGLFRHRETGLERVSGDRLDEYLQFRDSHTAGLGPGSTGYIRGSDEHYELYHRIEYRPNRLVVYPGCLLHSGLVNPENDVDADPRTGRLTANIFVDFFPLDKQG
jgi:hypothetical protein